MVNINLLIPNKYQPRKIFNDSSLNELASSIKEFGILNPILVRKYEDKYEIIAGERRYRAAKIAGLTEVPVIVKNVDENKLAEMALIENLQRENISPIEEAESYEQILNLSSLTEQRLSEIVGKSQSFISNKLRLLKLPSNIKEALKQRKISERHARSLLTVDDEQRQIELLNRVINEKLTVKELDNIINEKQITEDEINKAINDIMKTLNISEEEDKKEEKESDNMNNGNFFPNMNQNMQPGNQGASLNTMNMQTVGMPQMNQQPDIQPMMSKPINPQPEMPSPIPTFGPTVEMAPQPVPDYNMPTPEQPLFNSEATFAPPVDNFSMPMSEQQPLPQPETPSPIPTFGSTVEMAPQPAPDYSMPTPEQPLFNSEATFTSPVEPTYEVPVTTTPTEEFINQTPDKLTQVQNFLNQNGIQYKSYSNETGHCIIIEL